jgi:hypothetical protein
VLFLVTTVALAIVFAAVALVVIKRVRTGTWAMPTGQDIVWVRSRLGDEQQPPRIIYLNREPTVITAAKHDVSHANKSGLIERNDITEAKLPGFTGSKKTWRAIVKCVEKQFEPFDIRVVQERPAKPGYIMVLVGGRARDIGITEGHHVSGLAPFNSEVVPDPIVFAFAREVKNKSRIVCETIAMEVGHAYGLDHGYLCKDVMSYLTGCGSKSFVDKEVRCGEHKPRDCHGGAPTQNSYRLLTTVVGARKPAAPVTPMANEAK